jgi:hypothetical protein
MSESEPASIATRSRAVSIVAIANFVLGGVRLVLSVLAIWLLFQILSEGPAPNADVLKFLGHLLLVLVWPLLAAIAAVSICAGLLLIIAGFGLLRRRPWSRVLTMVLGVLGGILAGLYATELFNELIDGSPAWEGVGLLLLGTCVHGGYCTLVFVALANRRRAAEFTD